MSLEMKTLRSIEILCIFVCVQYYRNVVVQSGDILISGILLLHHHLLPLKLLTAGYMYITLCSISVRQRAAGLMALYWNGRSGASSFGYILRPLQKSL